VSDPRRLLDDPGSPEARLLASAGDEPPPPDLLARTLEVSVAAATGTALAASAAPGKVAAASAAKAAGGGILGAAGIGAIAGLLVVGAFEVASGLGDPPPVRAVALALPALAMSQALPALASAVPSASVETAPERPAPPRPPSPQGSARPSTLAAELELLDEARGALGGGDAARARALLDRYAREIPRGQMAREAALLRAEVDAALDEARAKERTNP
jgi:hypothetical protein